MPRMQVYLPEELHGLLKKYRLPASELLQKAVRAELRRQDLLAESDRYVAGLVDQLGPPSRAERSRAEAVARRIARRVRRRTG